MNKVKIFLLMASMVLAVTFTFRTKQEQPMQIGWR